MNNGEPIIQDIVQICLELLAGGLDPKPYKELTLLVGQLGNPFTNHLHQ